MARVVYIRHGAVDPDPHTPSPRWGLNDEGRATIRALGNALAPSPKSLWSSDEAKACETAAILCAATGVPSAQLSDLGETAHGGFLNRDAFEAAITQFFGAPNNPPNGWESARAAQDRGIKALRHICAQAPAGDIWVVGHGRMGALMNAAISARAISRALWPRHFGAWFSFDRDSWALIQDWQAP